MHQKGDKSCRILYREQANKIRKLSLSMLPRKLAYWMDRAQAHPSATAEKKVGKWTGRVAYQVFAMHPELREDGSFLRYFVARAGRRQGLRGTMLTAFVDKAFRDGIPADYFPAWFIAASTNTSQGADVRQGQ